MLKSNYRITLVGGSFIDGEEVFEVEADRVISKLKKLNHTDLLTIEHDSGVQIEIYGTLEHPLQKGCAAFIKENDGTRRTSAVQHFITVPSGTVYIETKNTHYVLKPPAAAPKEVRV